MKNFSLEAKIIQLVMKQVLGQQYSGEINPLLLSDTVDWIKVKDLLGYHEIAPFFYVGLKGHLHLLPREIVHILSNSYYFTLKDNLLKVKRFQLINQAFAENKVRMLPIKGIALLAQIYDKMPLRPMTDIDILIKEENFAHGIRILKKAGYLEELLGLKESYWLKEQCHLTCVKNREGKTGEIIEAHWSLDFRRNGRLVLAESWQRAKDIDTEDGRVGVLSPEDTFFSLALHQRRFGKAFCLKYILDIAFLFKKYGKEFDWDYFLSGCMEYGLSSCVGFLLLQGKLFLDSGLFDYGLERIPLSRGKRAIMERFILNNFASSRLDEKIKENYLKSHFLLYDTYSEPLNYLLHIPLEQFAKFHGLEPYKSKTKWLYAWRFIYSPFCSLVGFLTGGHENRGLKVGLNREDEGEQGLGVVRGWGWSMYPNIKDGDLVILKKKKPLRGEVVCFANDANTKTLHRLVRLNRGYLITRGDNSLGLDKAIKREEILGVAIAIKRGNRIISLKGRWLFGYLYFFSGLVIFGRNFLKKIIMSAQEWGIYSRIIRAIFSKSNIEVIKEAETEDFYFIKARVNGKEAATLKIDKKSRAVIYLYVKIIYRKLGLEEKLKEEGLKLCLERGGEHFL